MKTEYPLSWLDQLITASSDPSTGKAILFTPEETERYKERVAKEKDRIRLRLMHQVFSAEEEKKLEVLIPQYQHSLIRLLNLLEKNKNLPFGLRLFVKHAVEELLYFIERYFVKYFDTDQRVTPSYLKIHKKKWRLLQLEWEPGLKTDEAIYSLLSEVCHSFLSVLELSYQQMAYGDDLFSGLKQLDDTEGSLFAPLPQRLFYLNFNHAGFVAYLIKQFKNAMGADGDQAKKERLLFYQHSIGLQAIKPGIMLYDRLPSVIYSLQCWVDYQLKILQPEFKNDMIQHIEKQDESKVNLSVSVAMLGLFVRLLTEEEIIINSNQSELVRFFAAHFTTTRQNIISSESLYGSYYKPQPGTVRMMKDCLAGLQNTLHKKF